MACQVLASCPRKNFHTRASPGVRGSWFSEIFVCHPPCQLSVRDNNVHDVRVSPCVMSDHACYLGLAIWCQWEHCCHPAPPGCCCLVTGSLSNNTMQWTLIKCLLSNLNLMRKFELNLLKFGTHILQIQCILILMYLRFYDVLNSRIF